MGQFSPAEMSLMIVLCTLLIMTIIINIELITIQMYMISLLSIIKTDYNTFPYLFCCIS